MENIITDRRIQHLYEATAKDLYNLARNVYGNETEALSACVDAFAAAYVKMTGKKDIPDTDRFKSLSIRYLYVYGKKRKIAGRMPAETLSLKGAHEKVRADDRPELLNRLYLLDYGERFILFLFCCQKMRIKRISQILRLPGFLISRRLLSAVQKVTGA